MLVETVIEWQSVDIESNANISNRWISSEYRQCRDWSQCIQFSMFPTHLLCLGRPKAYQSSETSWRDSTSYKNLNFFEFPSWLHFERMACTWWRKKNWKCSMHQPISSQSHWDSTSINSPTHFCSAEKSPLFLFRIQFVPISSAALTHLMTNRRTRNVWIRCNSLSECGCTFHPNFWYPSNPDKARHAKSTSPAVAPICVVIGRIFGDQNLASFANDFDRKRGSFWKWKINFINFDHLIPKIKTPIRKILNIKNPVHT